MNIAEIKRIIQTEAKRHEHFKKAEQALMELESLEQYERDYTRRVNALKQEAEKLKEVNDGIDSSNKAADAEIKAKIELGNMTAADIVDKATAKAKELMATAQNDLLNLSATIVKRQEEINELSEKKELLSSELLHIEAALTAAKEKLKGFMGE